MDEFERRLPITPIATDMDLNAIQQQLKNEIAEAKRLFLVGAEQTELLTSEAGLKCITELIEAERKKQSA